jgi:hypothetical protein
MSQDWIIILSVVGTFGISAILYALMWLRKYLDRLTEKEESSRSDSAKFMEMQHETSKRQMDQMAQMLHSTLKSQEELQRKVVTEQSVKAENVGLNSGGYIIFNMPDSKKPLFHDLLKGFEDYAKLRGYEISFSIDNSFADKVAFKFTLDSVGINVSTKQVKQDLQDFINKVQKGDSLDDLPVVLSPEEHSLVLTCMKNRISFLQHNYNLQKNAAEFYMGLLKEIPSLGSSVSHPQNFYMLSGDGNQAALNSPQSIQGTGNRLIGNRMDQGIHIANSFNEREEQIRALSDLWLAIHHEQEKLPKESLDRENCSKAISVIHKAQTELKEEDPPDPNRINRWLQTAKNSLQAFALTKEVSDAAQAVWDAFKLSF